MVEGPAEEVDECAGGEVDPGPNHLQGGRRQPDRRGGHEDGRAPGVEEVGMDGEQAFQKDVTGGVKSGEFFQVDIEAERENEISPAEVLSELRFVRDDRGGEDERDREGSSEGAKRSERDAVREPEHQGERPDRRAEEQKGREDREHPCKDYGDEIHRGGWLLRMIMDRCGRAMI